MINKEELKNMSIKNLYDKYDYLQDFFLALALSPPDKKEEDTITKWIEQLDPFLLEAKGIDSADIEKQFYFFLESMEERLHKTGIQVDSITIIGGFDKTGKEEAVEIHLKKGDVVSIVGPTGSGKSRLLADIEWLAQKDTPTGRKILINDKKPPIDWRFSIEHKLVAQLSQNMNFVMDLKVGEFIDVHMESRMINEKREEKKGLILEEANRLAGEPIYLSTPITALSGGQSRALMIADTAYLSSSPIVLIDEIENAGIDKKIAVDLLMKAEKIVLIATHDPVLALRADRRIVIRNGGIHKILITSSEEKEKLGEIEQLNEKLMNYREILKSGNRIC